MAISENATPESEAKRWFLLAIVGAFLYGTAVVVFVYRDVEPTDPGKHVKFEPPQPAAAPAHAHGAEGEHHGHAD